VKIFTMLTKDEVDALVTTHAEAPHMRALQKRLAQEITIMVHGVAEYESALEASQILFGSGTAESLAKLSKETFLAVFEGVPTFTVTKSVIESGMNVVELLAAETTIFPSKGEARKMIQGGGVSINKGKIETPEVVIDSKYIINNLYILVQKGKKNYFIIELS